MPLWMLLLMVPTNDIKSPTVCFLNISKKIQLLKQWKRLSLINDGASWKLEDAGTVFGQALFGTLSSSPVEDKQETNG